MDIASAVLRQFGEDQLGTAVLFVNTKTGLPDEGGAQIFDSRLSEAISSAVSVGGGVVKGVLAVQCRLSRTTPITGSNAKLNSKVRIVPIPLVGEFEGEISYARSVS
jgi:hypothetical protein